MIHDVIIVGGSYAGLSAALQLARARRSVLVIDAGERRNRFAAASHGFLGQDGSDPGRIVAEAHAQLLRYPTVAWHPGSATDAEAMEGGFRVHVADAGPFEAKRLVLATGVRDILPEVPGLAERWGRFVFHCPYCHGYELEMGRIGVLATSPFSMHQALMLPDWGRTTLFLNNAFEPNDGQTAQLHARGVTVERTPVERLAGERADLVLRDGRTVACDGLFVASVTQIASPVAERIGCRLEESPVGRFIATDATRQTSVPGVFACGDVARPAGSVAFAVGDGAQAGVGAHRSLLFGGH